MQTKKTGRYVLDADELPELSQQHMDFVVGLVEGKTATDAYIAVYGDDAIRKNIWARASRLKNNRKVRSWIDAMRLSDLQRGARTIEERVARMEALAEEAKLAGNYATAVMAEEKAGKLEGHYVEKSEIHERKTGVDDLLDQWEKATKGAPIVDNDAVTH